ncbi:hypothetical protein SUNI508_13862 [Seiridium unicorne]|uniref:Uncharacterized protein n=1 Tax=Seiridium unicorne TaxID=138068 RepID=A0ABR2VAN9_9PEZI
MSGLDNDDHNRTKLSSSLINATTPPTLDITLLRTASTLGPGFNRTESNNDHMASELALSSDGRFLYVSSRNTVSSNADSLAIFSVQQTELSYQPLKYLGQSSKYA